MPAPDYHNYHKKVVSAAGRVDTDATPAQREALNFRQGTVFVHGLSIAIENPKGSYRCGVGENGKAWRRIMSAHYGRIKRTEGRDGEPVDVFIGDHPKSQLVFVISQLNADGSLDEHKVVMGTFNGNDARDLYLSHYPEGWKENRLGEIRGYTMKQFKKWLQTDAPIKSSRQSNKTAAIIDYRSVADRYPDLGLAAILNG